jgi:hypothetical protein
MPVNILEGPGLFVLNLGAHKDFALMERARLLLQFTATNALNNVNYGLPSSNISSAASVGRITSAGPARVGQVALRLEF